MRAKIVLDSQPFDPGLLVEEVAELAAPLAASKGLGLTSFVASEVPERLSATRRACARR